jgi:protein-tyrosine phosphatase
MPRNAKYSGPDHSSVDTMRPIFSSRDPRRHSRFNHPGPNESAPSRITEHLHIGGKLGMADLKALSRDGVSVIINMQRERQDHFRSSQWVDAYLWLPVTDEWPPSMAQLQMGVAFIREAVASGKGVLVHCQAGQGRGPLLCVCYLLEQGFTQEDALSRVTAARSHVQLSLEQQIRLHEYAALLQGERERLRQEAETQAKAAEARAVEVVRAEILAAQAREAAANPPPANQATEVQVPAAPATKPQIPTKRSTQPPAHSLSRDIVEFAGLLQSALRTPNMRVAKKKPRVQEKQPSDSTSRAMSNGTSPE